MELDPRHPLVRLLDEQWAITAEIEELTEILNSLYDSLDEVEEAIEIERNKRKLRLL